MGRECTKLSVDTKIDNWLASIMMEPKMSSTSMTKIFKKRVLPLSMTLGGDMLGGGGYQGLQETLISCISSQKLEFYYYWMKALFNVY